MVLDRRIHAGRELLPTSTDRIALFRLSHPPRAATPAKERWRRTCPRRQQPEPVSSRHLPSPSPRSRRGKWPPRAAACRPIHWGRPRQWVARPPPLLAWPFHRATLARVAAL